MANLIKRTESGQALQRRDPFQDMRNVMRDWMGWDPFQAMVPLTSRAFRDTFEPGFDVRETGNSYVIEADLPGVKPDDVEITLTGNRLQITGKRETEEESKQGTYFCSERFFGTFTRAFTLPEGTDAEHAASHFRDGVLTVTIPKRPEAQPRRIQIGPAAKTKA